MAKDGGGGTGVFGWTLLGFLAGIAATLGVQILIGGHEQPSPAVANAGAVHIITSAGSAAAKPVAKVSIAASASPAAVPVAVQSEAEVADDAAAAGMTSRITPINEQPTDRGPTVNSN